MGSSDLYWSLDLEKPLHDSFTYDLGSGGWGNDELQTYTDLRENSFTNDQKDNSDYLTIRAIAKLDGSMTSARLVTRQCLDLDEGYVEATIKAPQAKGIWYAFWLLPCKPFAWPYDGECDIAEGWNADRVNGQCMHWGHFDGKDWDKHRVLKYPLGKDGNASETFHTYGFSWSSKGLLWYFDGLPTMRCLCPAGIRAWRDFQIIFNIAMGGNVMGGQAPAVPSQHDMLVCNLRIMRAPPGGWQAWDAHWRQAREGDTM